MGSIELLTFPILTVRLLPTLGSVLASPPLILVAVAVAKVFWMGTISRPPMQLTVVVGAVAVFAVGLVAALRRGRTSTPASVELVASR